MHLPSNSRRGWQQFRAHPGALLGMGLLVSLSMLALLAPWLAPFDPMALDLRKELLLPSWPHVLGTDPEGMDILSRLLFGARVSLGVAFATVSVCLGVGLSLGALAGWSGGWLDRGLSSLSEMFQSLPGMLTPLLLSAFMSSRGVEMVIVALCVSGWVSYYRLSRAQVRLLKTQEYVLAAQAAGIPPVRILWRYVLPGVLPSLVVQAAFGMAGAVMAEAGLSFLGLGVEPGTASWGAMLSQGRQYILVAPQLSIYPGVAILLLVMALQFVGDGLREALDPRARQI